MVSLHNQAGDVMYVTSRNSVHDNPVTESYVQWHLSSYFDFMTDKRMTFDEFIAEHGILSLQPKKPVSTMNVVDQFGRADNIMCKMYQTSQDYLLHQLKHYSEAVIDIKRNSIGTELKPSNRILSKLVTRLYYRPQQQYRTEGWNFAENAQLQK